MVATNIRGDRQEDQGYKDKAGGHHGNGVEDAGEEVNCPETFDDTWKIILIKSNDYVSLNHL